MPFTVTETVQSLTLYFPLPFFPDIKNKELYRKRHDEYHIFKKAPFSLRLWWNAMPSFVAVLWACGSFRFVGDGCPVVNVASLLCSLCWLWSAFAFAGVSEFLAASHECVFWKSFSTFGATIIGTKPRRTGRRVYRFTHSGLLTCFAISF